jgi:uncharacterized NAD(P)/FAD-binding protein YdhS
MEPSEKILIVGGGASGVLSAIALQRAGVPADSIEIAEPRELLGEGLAYQTRDPHHRLNVPTGRMSAIEELPNDFVEWSNAESYSFMERRTYGFYLRDRLGEGNNHLRTFVTNLEVVNTGQVLATFASGEKQSYKAIVLAMGHGKARIPDFFRETPESPRIIQEVWDGKQLPESRTLVCFGTGLSFIDIALTHLSRDSENRVIAISGSGNLPERHQRSPITPFTPSVESVSTLEKLRTYLLAAGDSWREAVDGLRPITEAMWRGFSIEEREEFLRTDGSTWSRRRHRIAPEVADEVGSNIALGRIDVYRGRVASVIASESNVKIVLTDGSEFSGDYLAICIGRDYELSDPLTLNLLKDGKAARGPLGMGVSVDVTTGRLNDGRGSIYSQIYAIGPLRSGEAFESTAIPEIRKQATLVAQRIVSA